MNYCGIFCNPQKGSETTGKIRCYLPAPGGISHIRDVSVFRSGYYDFVHRLGRPEKDAGLAEEIRQQQNKSHGTYGYRRMQIALAAKGIHRNPKTVLRVMKKYDLLAEIRRRRRWVNMGRQLHRYENLLNRQFRTDRPNHKWVTDISYIHTKQGVLYLSMIRPSIFQANSKIRHNSLYVKTGQLL